MASRHFGVIASAMLLAAVTSLSADKISAAAPGERVISFYHIHTKETLTIVYKRDGKYVPEALEKINWIMRDWRKNKSISIDPNTIDLIWEMHTELGSQQPVNIICGYRSRDTNEMLRKTRGGQASQSQHITGRAVDITFPDVPLKRMRYSALVRERGGVGYYPTSGIPFIHVDSARVRAWPRLPRYELALLFPNGHTKHMPASGGPITPSDVRVARAQHRDLAIQIAQFQELRNAPHPTTMVASAEPPKPTAAPEPAKPRLALASLGGGEMLPWSRKSEPAAKKSLVTWEPIPERPTPRPQVAALTTPPPAAAAPALKGQPKPVDRSSRFEPRKPVSKSNEQPDRSGLTALVAQAQTEPMPKLISEPKPAVRPSKALAEAAMPEINAKRNARAPARVAALIPTDRESDSITDMSPDSLGNGWVQAPEFDEDHPEELAYRPFPLGPLLTDDATSAEPQFEGLQHPDVAQTLELIDDIGAVLPMRFRPGQQVAQVMSSQQFQGSAVHLDALKELDQSRAATGISERTVQTSTRPTP
ncbi:MAG: DUF882 domain-containing protein [Hyphomicrobium sp.]